MSHMKWWRATDHNHNYNHIIFIQTMAIANSIHIYFEIHLNFGLMLLNSLIQKHKLSSSLKLHTNRHTHTNEDSNDQIIINFFFYLYVCTQEQTQMWNMSNQVLLFTLSSPIFEHFFCRKLLKKESSTLLM